MSALSYATGLGLIMLASQHVMNGVNKEMVLPANMHVENIVVVC